MCCPGPMRPPPASRPTDLPSWCSSKALDEALDEALYEALYEALGGERRSRAEQALGSLGDGPLQLHVGQDSAGPLPGHHLQLGDDAGRPGPLGRLLGQLGRIADAHAW